MIAPPRLRRVVAVLVAVLAGAGAEPAAASVPSPVPRTPIRHFITLMQENHSFDNYFGTFPGADGIPAGTCEPVNPRRPGAGCIRPFHLGGRAIEDLGHTKQVFQDQYRGGRLDGFVDAVSRGGVGTVRHVMGYYDDRDIPYYWNIAREYVLFDRFFTSAAAGSVQNHMYWVSGTPGMDKGDSIPANGFGNISTIFDRLEASHVSWKFYVQDYDPTVTYRSKSVGDKGAQPVWVPLLAYDRYLDNSRLRSHIVDLDQFYADLQRGSLPAVSYIVPAGSSEHPPGSIQAGERFIRSLIGALMQSSSWRDSAFMWSYDDWGGWYDHVRPPRVDRFGYGFRAPALLVSARARRGLIDSTTLDFTSMLKFIEYNWRLLPLARRDARANNFLGAFDFSRPPREPRILPATRHVAKPPEPRRAVVYQVYGAALGLAALVLLGAATAGFRRRRASSRTLVIYMDDVR